MGTLRNLPQLGNLSFIRVRPSQEKGQRLQFNPDVVDMLSILKRQLRYLGAGERHPLDKAVMLELNQRFANYSLPHSKLLGKFSFNDLFSTPDLPGNDGFTQRINDDLAEFKASFDPTYLEKLDPGETESLLHILSLQSEDLYLCSADAIVF